MPVCRTIADIEAAALAAPPDEIRDQDWANRVAVILAPHIPQLQAADAA